MEKVRLIMERLVSVNNALSDAQKNQEKRATPKELPKFNGSLPSLTEEDRQRAMEKFETVSKWADEAAQRILDIQDQLSQILKLKGWKFVPSLIAKEKSLRNEINRLRAVDEESLRILEERIRSMAKEREKEKINLLLAKKNEFLSPRELNNEAPAGNYIFHAPYKRGEGGRVQLEGLFILRIEETPKGKILVPVEGYGCFRWVGQPPGHCFLPLRSALNGWISSAPAGEIGEFLRKLARTVSFLVRDTAKDEKESSSSEEQGS
jgi:hypothetical protein